MKKLEIEKTKSTFIISTFKTDIIKVGLVFSISNFFIAKTSLANNWRSFSSSYLALERKIDVPKLNSNSGLTVLNKYKYIPNIGKKKILEFRNMQEKLENKCTKAKQ